MNDSETFVKTALGLDEVRSRALKLSQRLRTMLIMVDGTRTVAQLRQAQLTLAAPPDFLENLLALGLVVSNMAPAAAGLKAVDIQLAIQSMPGALATPDLATCQRAAVRDLNNVLGPTGESLAIRMERARSVSELRELVRTAAQIIGNARGRAAAEAYLAQHDY